MALTLACAARMLCAVSAADSPLPAQSRLGINLSGPVDWNTEHPFVDVFRLSRIWISQRQNQPWGKGPALELDAHGWIKRLEPDCYAETPVLTAGHAPLGEYVCLYDGEGQIEFGANSKIVSRVPGRIVVDIQAKQDGTFLQLRHVNPANPVRNIRLLMPGFEKTWQNEPFSPVFLNRWRNFNTFRFMDWMQTNGSEQRNWADRPKLDDATWTVKGIPLEVMIDLCNRLKINPWFCLPHEASDDYVRHFAELVRSRLDPSLKIHVEYSNEVWNGIFKQHAYAEEQGQKLGLGPKERPWEGAAMFYARRSLEIFRIWEEVLGGRERLVRVLAWQAASGPYWTDNMLLSQQDTGLHCDALAIAPYLTFLPGPNNPGLNSDQVAKWTVEQVLDYVETNCLPESAGWIETQKAVADKYHLNLLCYEAGQHLVGVAGGENNADLTRVLTAANQHPRMGAIYAKYLDAWRDSGGGLMCLFSSVCTSGKYGSWGLLESADETASPKFDAVMQWNRANPR
jgi:hypothetical protein